MTRQHGSVCSHSDMQVDLQRCQDNEELSHLRHTFLKSYINNPMLRLSIISTRDAALKLGERSIAAAFENPML